MISIFIFCSGSSETTLERSLLSLERQDSEDFEVVLLGNIPRDVSLQRRKKLKLHLASKRDFDHVLNGDWDVEWTGDKGLVLNAGDLLSPDAVGLISMEMASAVDTADIAIFDHVQREGEERRLPGWDPHLLECADYIRGACFSRRIVDHVSKSHRPADLREFLRYAVKTGARTLHIAEPLLKTDDLPPEVGPIPTNSEPLPPLSIIIPNKNGMDLLPKCLEFASQASFQIQIVIVDNGSSDPFTWEYYEKLKGNFETLIVPFNQTFNYSAMINRGVMAAVHEHILLLNNDVHIGSVAELEAAILFARRPEVGVVGSVLRYPDGSIQHAGIVLSWDNGDCDAHHILRHEKEDERGFIGALSAPRNFQAVTGAFQLTRKSFFQAVGGYDETNLPVEHNDVDYCLRIRAKGLHVINLPLKSIVHDESSTRSKMVRSEAVELANAARKIMKARWPQAFDKDPYYNPYLREKRSSGWRDPNQPRHGFGRSFWLQRVVKEFFQRRR